MQNKLESAIQKTQTLSHLVRLIEKSQSILLSTHRQCDGDGLGAELALYFALKKMGKKVQVVNVDATPRKYRFLNPDNHIQYFEQNPNIPQDADLVLIFDTNDERLLFPLFEKFQQLKVTVVFIDHHPLLKLGPRPKEFSWIETRAASTGEMAYVLIKALGIDLDCDMARALYTSITFDTQIFRYIRNSSASHEIAAELVRFPIDPHLVHKHLFGEQTIEKMNLLSQALGQIEYHYEGRVAVVRLKNSDLRSRDLDPDDARDIIDFVMNIETLEAAVLFREDGPELYKISLRSKGHLDVLAIAESLGGGGHIYASGSLNSGSYEDLKSKILLEFNSCFAA